MSKQLTNEQLANFAITGTAWPDESTLPPETLAYWTQTRGALKGSSLGSDELASQVVKEGIKKVVLPRVHKASLVNPLSFMREENMPYGDFMEDSIVAPAKPIAWDPNTPDSTKDLNPFQAPAPDVKASYIRVNRQQILPVSYRAVEFGKFFTDNNGYEFDAMLSYIAQSLDEGNKGQEYIFSKMLIKAAIENKDYPLQADQTVLIPDIRDFTLSDQDVRNATAILKSGVTDMQYNSSSFNAGGVEKAGGQIYLMFNKDALINQAVKTWAYAFNPEYLKQTEDIYQVESFGKGLEDVIAIAVEKETFSTHYKEIALSSIENPASGRWNSWFRIQQALRYNPFGQMRVFKAKPATPGV